MEALEASGVPGIDMAIGFLLPFGCRRWLILDRTTAAQQKKKYYEAVVVKSLWHLLASTHGLWARAPAQTVLEERKELRPLLHGFSADVLRNIVRQQLDVKEAQHVAAIKEATFARSLDDGMSIYSDVLAGPTLHSHPVR